MKRAVVVSFLFLSIISAVLLGQPAANAPAEPQYRLNYTGDASTSYTVGPNPDDAILWYILGPDWRKLYDVPGNEYLRNRPVIRRNGKDIPLVKQGDVLHGVKKELIAPQISVPTDGGASNPDYMRIPPPPPPPAPARTEVQGAASNQMRQSLWSWDLLWRVIAVALLLFVAWHLVRLFLTDPVSSGPAIVQGGIHPRETGAIQNHFTRIALNFHQSLGLGDMRAPYRVSAVEYGYLRGFGSVRYDFGIWALRFFWRNTAYRASFRFADGSVRRLIFLEGCGNDVSRGVRYYFRFFSFTRAAILIEEPAPITASVTESGSRRPPLPPGSLLDELFVSLIVGDFLRRREIATTRLIVTSVAGAILDLLHDLERAIRAAEKEAKEAEAAYGISAYQYTKREVQRLLNEAPPLVRRALFDSPLLAEDLRRMSCRHLPIARSSYYYVILRRGNGAEKVVKL